MRKENKRTLEKAFEQAFGKKPVEVDAQLVTRTEFYKEILLNIVKGRFKVKCPREWDTDYMLDCLLTEGKFAITDTRLGVIPLSCGVHGINVFLRPTDLIIANPVLGNIERKLYKDACIVYLYDNLHFRNINWILDIYAQKLANCDCAIDVNLLNTRAGYVFEAANNKQADEIKKIYTDLSQGKPAVYYKNSAQLDISKNGLNVFTLPIKNNFIADDLQQQKMNIVNEFLTIFGINNANTEKKERLIVAEAESNNAEILYNIQYCKDNLKRCCREVNEMFPWIELKIKFRKEKKGMENSESDRLDRDMSNKN